MTEAAGREGKKMKELYFDGELSLTCGGSAYVQGAKVIVPEDATMNQIVTAIRDAGYSSFMLPTMRRLVRI